jgi:hypothetical protein
VICSDTYGNKIRADVIDGKAEFTGLVPNTAYSIKVTAKGFHRLTGSASTAYSTPIQTNIVQFDAISGSTEDSVILSFTAEGPESNEWTVEYSAEGEEPHSATFVDSQMVTITNLTVGKAYTFHLVPKQALYLTGQTEIVFTPRKLIRAEKLSVTSCIDNKLTVSWAVPEGESVSGWSVRCHNDNYSQTIVTTDTTATFEGLDHTAEFDVEVKAIGMSVDVSGNNLKINGKFTPILHADKFYREDEVFWLGRIIHAESEGEPLLGKIAVGNVVLNRVKSAYYPNTIYGVIFDRKYGVQFSPVLDGSIYNTPSYNSVLAAKICLEGYSLAEGVFFFLAPEYATSSWIPQSRKYAFTIGNHDFYY